MSRVSPQDLVENCLAASTVDDQIAFVVESSEANLRWAANSLTTNGSMRSRQVVVVSFVDGGAGVAAGTVSRTGTPDVAELVAASEQAARDAGEDHAAHFELVDHGRNGGPSDDLWAERAEAPILGSFSLRFKVCVVHSTH